jgi:hypothetical protein
VIETIKGKVSEKYTYLIGGGQQTAEKTATFE